MLRIAHDDGNLVAEHDRAVRHNRQARLQLLKRLQRQGPDPYAVLISVPVLSRIHADTDCLEAILQSGARAKTCRLARQLL